MIPQGAIEVKMKAELNAHKLSELLSYDASTGIFTWNQDRFKTRVGTKAGTVDEEGYIRIQICGRRYRAHRLAWLHWYGEMPDKQIDHINGRRSDNRIENLRLATNSQNSMNRRSGSSSGVKGVYFHSKIGKYQAEICRDGKKTYLGVFPSKDEAEQAYRAAASKLHGDFARLF